MSSTPPERTKRCVICGRPQTAERAPFCSQRCADIDLHRWLTGAYAIPAVEDTSDGETGERGESEPGA